MPLFRLISTTPPEALAIEFYGDNASAAINVAKRTCLEEADLWQESDYLFTLRQHGNDFWIIFRKQEMADSQFLVAALG